MPPGDGMLTIIHDPEDDPQITRDALAAHNPEHRQITVHPTAGTESAIVLGADVLAALGCSITQHTTRRQHLGTALHAFAAAAAWLLVDGIEVVIVPRAHLLSPPARHWLSRLATTAHLRVVAVWHGPAPQHWAEAFRHPQHLVRETEDLNGVLAGARPRPPVAHSVGEPMPEALPTLAELPHSGMARFRAEAYRTLDATQFAALDAHYRYGLHAACQWLGGHELYHTLVRTLAPAATQRRPDEPVCLARALGRGRPVPLRWSDTAGLQAFLSGLAVTSPVPAALIARVRGAQAGMLLHGVLLQVPLDLASAHGPGLTGIRVTEQITQRIRRALPNPRFAAAVAVAALTGARPSDVALNAVAPLPRHSSDLVTELGGWSASKAVYRVPLAAEPLLRAAAIFCALTRDPSPGSLFAALHPDEVNAAAAATGLSLGRPWSAGEPSHAWHAASAAWLVGEPLHRTGPGTNDPLPVAVS